MSDADLPSPSPNPAAQPDSPAPQSVGPAAEPPDSQTGDRAEAGGRHRPRPHHPPDGPSRFGIIWFLICYWAALLLGWLVAELIFSLTGRPSQLLAYIIGISLGMALAVVAALIAARTARHARGSQWGLGDQILHALERIGQGDFDVRIDASERGPLSDVVASVNKMAHELGTLEQQRQDFVSNVSHEIQSPLTSIMGFASLLRQDDLDPATRRHYLGIITAECQRLSALGSNLLRLSALDDATLNRQDIRLDDQLRDVIVALEPQWSPKGLDVSLEARPILAQADAELLRQVWVNLVQNAIKFTPAGGRILVRVSPSGGLSGKANPAGRAADPGRADPGRADPGHPNPTEPPGQAGPSGQTVATASSTYQVEVIDTGEGIAPTDLPHVFERFYRADKARSAGGSGLGLALAKRIVDLHGGRISVTSGAGQGSAFTVRLPAQPGTHPA